ncbi:MAG: hypothetical protein B7Y45_00155 [Sphingomonas sp. 28-66-16]|nr:MAG: hypothetical protein B7Y45_00155 [Sphingomonas sp. 28-66-16]
MLNRPSTRARLWQPRSATIDCLIGMLLIAGAGLTILPGMAALALFAMIAALFRPNRFRTNRD